MHLDGAGTHYLNPVSLHYHFFLGYVIVLSLSSRTISDPGFPIAIRLVRPAFVLFINDYGIQV